MLHRSKILAGIVLSATKQLRFQVTDNTDFDTNVDITIPAGTWYIAWDAESDDLLWKIMSLAYTGLDALAAGGGADNYNGSDAVGKPHFTIDTSGKVTVSVGGGHAMKIDWTALDGVELGAYLGFSTAAALTISAGVTADYQHGYGWYADEDGYIASLETEDVDVVEAAQAVGLTGATSTQFVASRGINQLALQHVPRARMFSHRVSYGSAPAIGYERNVGLECLWRAIRTGTPFRIYREGRVGVTAADLGAVSEYAGTVQAASSTTQVTDTGKAYDVEPFELVGKLVAIPDWNTGAAAGMRTQRFYVASHTATVITMSNTLFNRQHDATATQYYVLDQRYETYVVDLNQMREFRPGELAGGVERYGITIPLLRYVA